MFDKDRFLLVCAGMGGEKEMRSKRTVWSTKINSKEVLEKQQGMDQKEESE